MKSLVVPEHPLTSNIPDADLLICRAWAEDFVENYVCCSIEEMQMELAVRYIVVFRYRGKDSDGEALGGWIITGNMPLLALNDEEITTPMEALAIYCYFLIPWLDAKGVIDPEGNLPDYRVPPDWLPLAFHGGYEESRIGGITAFIQWKLIEANEEEIVHPDIREYCYRRGWLNRPGAPGLR